MPIQLICRKMALTLFAVLCICNMANSQELKALLIEGQNNHKNWPTTSLMMKSYLEETDLFSVDIVRTKAKGTDPNFSPDFSQYDVVVSNYNGAQWPDETKTAFIQYIKEGGGLVVVHAADNAFGNWREYNEMIGLGGWGGRNEKSGPYVYFDNEGNEVRDETKGGGGHHGPQHPFSLVARDSDHPIMQDIPSEWLHVKDELYDKLRGPAANMKILATSFASENKGGTGRHEPMIMTIDFGKGRVFHTPMGHGNYSQECVGFITVLQRGTQWAATGEVTIGIPADFPTPDKVSQRPFVDSIADAQLGNTKNVHQAGDLFLAGQPTQTDISTIAEKGIKHVITLRKSNEVDWNEKTAVEKAGMEFHTIEFGSADELTDEVFGQVRDLLQKTGEEKVLLHCGSANRVGAVWAAHRALDRGVGVEDAIKQAKEIGLRSEALETKAKEYIQANQR